MAVEADKRRTNKGLAGITPWITAAAVQHPRDLAAHLVQRLACSRRVAFSLLRQLVAAQWLVVAGGTPRKPVHAPGALRQVVRQYPLLGLQEDLPWKRDFAPFFALPGEVRRMAQHAFTELLNNAVDHSGGSTVTVSLRQTPLHLQLLVSDDGCGLFERVAQSFAIDDPALAMLELSKGKLTSQPERHSGHGLFFSARLADVFDVHANRAGFQYRGWDAASWHVTRAAPHTGTSVYMAIALDTRRTLDSVLRAASSSGGYGFERTRVPLRLIGDGQALASRADARRVASRLEGFQHAEIDFSGIDDVGHAFADELFRVFRRLHPGVELAPVGMTPRVSAMLQSVGA
jgi:anti-sigma regulatory factor (Ser/Thr protein kinase)